MAEPVGRSVVDPVASRVMARMMGSNTTYEFIAKSNGFVLSSLSDAIEALGVVPTNFSYTRILDGTSNPEIFRILKWEKAIQVVKGVARMHYFATFVEDPCLDEFAAELYNFDGTNMLGLMRAVWTGEVV